MKISIVSSSLDPASRSRKVARVCESVLKETHGAEVQWIDLRDWNAPNFDNDTIFKTDTYRDLHKIVKESEGLIFATPVYNWDCGSELKKFIEYIGSTPPDGSIKGAFFDKVITFVCSAGVPHSYMAPQSLSAAMQMDFKCIINPYQIYVHNGHWEEESLNDEATQRIQKSMLAFTELTELLKGRTYESAWEI